MAEHVEDLSNFSLHTFDAATVAGGLLPEMAEVFGVDFDPEHAAQSLTELSGAIGKSKVLQDNIGQVQEVLGTDQDGLSIAADWLERSGVQKALDRNLWTPGSQTPRDVGAIVMTDSMANGQDRTTALLQRWAEQGRSRDELPRVFLATGNRIMDTKTEVTNASVEQMYDVMGRYPTGYEYGESVVRPTLVSAGYKVTIIPYDTANGSEVADRFISDYPAIFGGEIAFARVANSGVQLAGQFRRAVHARGWNFDTAENPQVYILTDEQPIARNEEELSQSRRFQNPHTGIHLAVQTARNLALMTQ